jgi:hypothetical protein
MMERDISEWSFLWTSRSGDYVLWSNSAKRAGESYFIYNIRNCTILLLEDDELLEQITKKMKESGIPIVAELPENPLIKIIDQMFAEGKSLDEINEMRRRLFLRSDSGSRNDKS